ncbi:MAG: acyl-CoA dehydrogenase family protein [Oleiphilaceae bacterium]|nr:acyl-CoA dehydrogenase family protein [Oleiphilaceae bacterium]
MSNYEPKTNYWAETHRVENVPKKLVDYNSFCSDKALLEAIKVFGPGIDAKALTEFGLLTGSERLIDLGFDANHYKPELHTHNRRGERVDEIKYHAAYHELMNISLAHGIHSSHWEGSNSGHHIERAAMSYMMTQVEAGHGCPITMTSASIPSLRRQPDLYEKWAPKILSRSYDPRNIPHSQKDSVTIGMAMTEKQGGSDVRKNTTRAYPVSKSGGGALYELVGHKYFVSAPMCDAFLVLAQTDQGVSCFLVPRWREDGTKNPIQIQKLKNKMGNVSNASSETELRGAQGWLIGKEGKGVATIIEMVAMTRFDCMIGSSAGMRQAVVQAISHCKEREAFGNNLRDQPLMKNVLADLAIESEAAMLMTMRMAKALENSDDNEKESMLARLGTAVGKYWICKRTPAHAYEAMECIGGMGVMEDTIMPRLFRESPINAIWEGSGNVQCLDMLRAISRSPETLDAIFEELDKATGKSIYFDDHLRHLKLQLEDKEHIEFRSRTIVEQLALALQGACLLLYGNEVVAEAFCMSRLQNAPGAYLFGTLPTMVDCDYIIDRAAI